MPALSPIGAEHRYDGDDDGDDHDEGSDQSGDDTGDEEYEVEAIDAICF